MVRSGYAIVFSIATMLLCLTQSAYAVDVSNWTNQGVDVTQKSSFDYGEINASFPFCQQDRVTLQHGATTYFNQPACVLAGKYMSVAMWGLGTYIKYNNDNRYHYYDRSNWERLQPVPGTDRIAVYSSHAQTNGGDISVYDNTAARLTLSPGYARMDKRDNPLVTVSGSAFNVSENGRYLVYLLDGGYNYDDIFMRVDLVTGEDKEFGRGWYSHTYNPLPLPNMAISNDGRFVVAGGIGSIKLWDLSSSCLRPWIQMYAAYPDHCPSRVLQPESYGEAYSYDARTLWFRFSSRADRLSFLYQQGSNKKMVTMKPNSLPALDQLQYLALGDSYSSGEGDIDKKPDGTAYYLMTNNEINPCHVSERSYPFWLKNRLGLNENNMKSVACSGAELSMDYYAPPDSYMGQGDELKGMDQQQARSVMDGAVGTFRPGIAPQLEFIKKYQPKVVTLTGGGNDVGFQQVLEYCAAPMWEGFFWNGYTCDYAKQGTELNKILGRAIYTQYDYTRLFLKKIKQASPDTKVYVVGYPIFIGSSDMTCGLNSGALDTAEMKMMHEGIRYMNQVLQRAAESEGAYYRDVESVLEGGRLCEGSQYVSGVWDLGPNKVLKNELSESFHPNATGHRKMFERIAAQGVSVDPEPSVPSKDIQPPPIPTFFGGVSTGVAVKKQMTLLDTIVQGISVPLALSSYSFSPNTKVTVQGYSQTVNLGEYTTDSEGGLQIDALPLADMPLGRHMLVIKGASMSGEQITYYQPLNIASKDKNDSDGDGVANAEDRCMFVDHWYDESTKQDTCKITTAPTPESSPMPTHAIPTKSQVSVHVDKSTSSATITNSPPATQAQPSGALPAFFTMVPSVQLPQTTTVVSPVSMLPMQRDIGHGDIGKYALYLIGVIISGCVVLLLIIRARRRG